MSEKKLKKKEKPEVNFCSAFLQKIIQKQGFENKVRYLLEDFFFDEGWASKTNPKAGKNGNSHQYTYNYSTIRHFIEDFVRWSQRELKIMQNVHYKTVKREYEKFRKEKKMQKV